MNGVIITGGFAVAALLLSVYAILDGAVAIIKRIPRRKPKLHCTVPDPYREIERLRHDLINAQCAARMGLDLLGLRDKDLNESRAAELELTRKYENQKSFISAYAHSLDGLLKPSTGCGMDGTRDAREIRIAYERLAARYAALLQQQTAPNEHR